MAPRLSRIIAPIDAGESDEEVEYNIKRIVGIYWEPEGQYFLIEWEGVEELEWQESEHYITNYPIRTKCFVKRAALAMTRIEGTLGAQEDNTRSENILGLNIEEDGYVFFLVDQDGDTTTFKEEVELVQHCPASVQAFFEKLKPIVSQLEEIFAGFDLDEYWMQEAQLVISSPNWLID